MKKLFSILALLLALFTIPASPSFAQGLDLPDLQLPDGIAGEDYKVYGIDLRTILEKKIGAIHVSYQQPKEFEWNMVGGMKPEGIALDRKGHLWGVPSASDVKDLPYVFRVSFKDREFSQEVNVILRVKRPRLIIESAANPAGGQSAASNAPQTVSGTEPIGNSPAITIANPPVVTNNLASSAHTTNSDTASPLPEDPIVTKFKDGLADNKDAKIRKFSAVRLGRMGGRPRRRFPS